MVAYRPRGSKANARFDELTWFDETRAVTPLMAPAGTTRDLPETYPFGL